MFGIQPMLNITWKMLRRFDIQLMLNAVEEMSCVHGRIHSRGYLESVQPILNTIHPENRLKIFDTQPTLNAIERECVQSIQVMLNTIPPGRLRRVFNSTEHYPERL